MPGPITVLVVDDHPMMREGVAATIRAAEDLQVVAEASSGEAAIDLYRRHRPDVVVMDVQMPGIGGIGAMEEIRREFADARVIFLTVQGGDAPARRAIKSGAASYLLKSAAPDELRNVVRRVHAGQRCIPSEVAGALAEGLSRETLSKAEIDVLRLVAAGHSNKRIAGALDAPEETIKSRMKQILAKLDASDRTHAVTLALRRGIIEL